MINGAYCVVNAHNMLPWSYYDIENILCRYDSIMIMEAYCVSKSHNMLP